MSKITFDQIISGKVTTEPLEIKVSELDGEVDIHQLNGLEMMELTADQRSFEEDNDLVFGVMYKWVYRFLKGQMPTDKQLKDFQKVLLAPAVKEIYYKGLSAQASSKEDLEKNS